MMDLHTVAEHPAPDFAHATRLRFVPREGRLILQYSTKMILADGAADGCTFVLLSPNNVTWSEWQDVPIMIEE